MFGMMAFLAQCFQVFNAMGFCAFLVVYPKVSQIDPHRTHLNPSRIFALSFNSAISKGSLRDFRLLPQLWL